MPLALGALVMLSCCTWRRGTRILFDKTRKLELPLADLVANLEKNPPQRVPGTAVFLTGDPDMRADRAAAQSQALQGAARAQRHPDDQDRADAARRPTAERVRYRADQRDLLADDDALRLHGAAQPAEGARDCAQAGLEVRHHVDVVLPVAPLGQPAPHSGMPLWQDKLFIALARNADDATDYFQIPTGRVVEIGTQVTV